MTTSQADLDKAHKIIKECYPSVDVNMSFDEGQRPYTSGDLIRVAVAALKYAANERDSTQPPAHWTPDPESERHPQTAEEWNWREDSWMNDALGRSTKRLNFMADLADPAAPDQMATVLRIDLMRVAANSVWQTARTEMYSKILAERNTLREQVSEMLDAERASFDAGFHSGTKNHNGGNIPSNRDIEWAAYQVRKQIALAKEDKDA